MVLPQHKGVLRAARQRSDSQCFDASEWNSLEGESSHGGANSISEQHTKASDSVLGAFGQQLL